MMLGGWCVVTTGSWPKGSLSTLLPSTSWRADCPESGSLQWKPESQVGQGKREGQEARGVRVCDMRQEAWVKKCQGGGTMEGGAAEPQKEQPG